MPITLLAKVMQVQGSERRKAEVDFDNRGTEGKREEKVRVSLLLDEGFDGNELDHNTTLQLPFGLEFVREK